MITFKPWPASLFSQMFKKHLLFSDNFCQEILEELSNNGHIIVQAKPTNKDEVKQWLEEFTRVAEVCYMVNKEHQGCRKVCRVDYICSTETEISVQSDNH